MKIKIISFIMCFIFPSVSFAEGKIASIKEGQKTPFTGFLLDPPAFAKIETDKQFLIDKCETEKNLLNQKCEAEKKFLNDSCLNDRERIQKVCDLSIKERDKEIERLNKIIIDMNTESPDRGLWFGLGTAAGVVVTLTTVYLVKKI